MKRGRQPGVTRWAIVSDLHFPAIHWPTWRCFRAWLDDVRPHGLVWLGDLLDFESLSRFDPSGDRDAMVLPEIRQFVREVNECHARVARSIVVEGNHEARFWHKLADGVNRQLKGLVGLSLREQCQFQGLDPLIEWHVEKAGWDGVEVGHAMLRHGDRDYPKGGPAHVAAHALARYYRSTIMGHVHRQQLWVRGRPNARTEYGLTNPTMQEQPHWDPRAHWSRGWTVLEVDDATGYAHPYPVLCEQGRTAIGGVVYDGAEGAGSVGAARARPTVTPRRTYIHHDGRTLPQIAEATGIPYRTLAERVRRGWPTDRLLDPPDPERSARRRSVRGPLTHDRPASE